MGIKKGEWFLILFNLAYILAFTVYYLGLKNYEFMLYIGVLVLVFLILFFMQRRLKISYTILWMISVWGLLHMMGGGVHLPNGTVLYRWIPFVAYDGTSIDSDFIILKFDQILHAYIYFVVSIVMYHLLKFSARVNAKKVPLMLFVILASMGVSVINELIEFGAVVFLGNTGVGGYYNTLLDLVFNSLGAVIGGIAALRLKR